MCPSVSPAARMAPRPEIWKTATEDMGAELSAIFLRQDWLWWDHRRTVLSMLPETMTGPLLTPLSLTVGRKTLTAVTSNSCPSSWKSSEQSHRDHTLMRWSSEADTMKGEVATSPLYTAMEVMGKSWARNLSRISSPFAMLETRMRPLLPPVTTMGLAMESGMSSSRDRDGGSYSAMALILCLCARTRHASTKPSSDLSESPTIQQEIYPSSHTEKMATVSPSA
mmetsp:Transcript_20610/g.45858  ORF Transcript_20610/g.45858 Transcript_20610/m.45858 type:complete len:224 (-) Transcript_20610:636-1307(-)